VKPAQKPNLKSFTVLAYVSKDGEWKSQFRLARIEVPKATEDEGKTKVVKVADGKGTKGATEVAGDDLKSPEILRSNFAIELVFRAEKGGRLIGKMATAGYELRLDEQGRALFQVAGPGGKGNLVSTKSVTDGKWHHLIAEADREAKTLTLYLDGKRNAQGPGIDANVSLANPGDLTVGGTADGDCIRGAIDFLRISRGTLADAKTTIEELYAWEFNGPHFRDFNGRLPADGTRDAGALEFTGR
ncbi:MAG: LamG domain-containing protein, partial [Victivallales bacterium]|nr:LamG domain-containing protein [Victivallales bacterium]